MAFTRHGHQIPNSPNLGDWSGSVVRCGGPAYCIQCAQDVISFLTQGVLPGAENTSEKKDEDPIKMETTKFVRKPFEVEAVQVTAENIEQVAVWCDGRIERKGEEGKDDRFIRVRVHNPLTEKQTQAFISNWVLYAGKGYKVYTDAAFRKNFIPVAEFPRSVITTSDSPNDL